MFTVANKLNELRDACKNAGIKATGKKPELIERLNYHAVIRAEVEAAETLLAAEAAEKLLASDADEEDEDAIVQITINRTAGEEVDPGEEDNDGAEEDELVANGNEFDQSISKTRSTVQTKKPREAFAPKTCGISALSRTRKKAKSAGGFAKNALKSATSSTTSMTTMCPFGHRILLSTIM